MMSSCVRFKQRLENSILGCFHKELKEESALKGRASFSLLPSADSICPFFRLSAYEYKEKVCILLKSKLECWFLFPLVLGER